MVASWLLSGWYVVAMFFLVVFKRLLGVCYGAAM